jgi:hypothetical protein
MSSDIHLVRAIVVAANYGRVPVSRHMKEFPTSIHYGGIMNANQGGLQSAANNLGGSSKGGKPTFSPKLFVNHWVQLDAFG